MLHYAFDLDEKYIRFSRKKHDLVSYYEAQTSISEETKAQMKSEIQNIQTEEEVEDWMVHIKRLVVPDISSTFIRQREKDKKPQKSDPISFAKQFGIDRLAESFGVSPLELGQYVRDSHQAFPPATQSNTLSDLANEWIEVMRTEIDNKSVPQHLGDTDGLVSACRSYLSFSISSEVHVRNSMRQAFKEHACIFTKPTPTGLKSIDIFSPYAHVKKIDNKPLKNMSGEQYLLICKAVSANLLSVEITVNEADYNQYFLGELKKYYCSDRSSSLDQQWNEERVAVLDIALKKILFPLFVMETKRRLYADGLESVQYSYHTR